MRPGMRLAPGTVLLYPFRRGVLVFERYTGSARRTIFFARYEASSAASPYIGSEHLLLGLLREDKRLADEFLDVEDTVESLRDQIARQAPGGAASSTSIDLPLSVEAKRILAYGAEEAERLGHRYIAPVHLLLGILKESECLAARLLAERQVLPEAVRAYAAGSRPDQPRASAFPAPLDEPPRPLIEWLAEREKAGGITVALHATVAGYSTGVAVYAGEKVLHDGDSLDGSSPLPVSPDEQIMELRKRSRRLLARLEHSIARHEFEAARAMSEQEQRLTRQLTEMRLQTTGPVPKAVPFLCVLLTGTESLTDLRSRIGRYLKTGVAHVWVLDAVDHRAYTATAAEGLREVVDGSLRIAEPQMEVECRGLFE